MKLLIIRHAIAVPRGDAGFTDSERPLTDRGAARFREAAAGLVAILPPPSAILTSPWKRALQTAGIASEAWGGPAPETAACLAEWNVAALGKRLAPFGGDDTVAIVGHEPDLSSLLAALVASPDRDRFAFRKGGAALLDLPGALKEGGMLLWHLPPRILRRLSRA